MEINYIGKGGPFYWVLGTRQPVQGGLVRGGEGGWMGSMLGGRGGGGYWPNPVAVSGFCWLGFGVGFGGLGGPSLSHPLAPGGLGGGGAPTRGQK